MEPSSTLIIETMSLFRPEAAHAQADRLHGEMILVRPVSSWVMTAAAMVIVTASIAYLALGNYTQRTTAHGVLVPTVGAVKVLPPEAGIIIERNTREGARVQRGDVLFVIANERRLVMSGAQLSDELHRILTRKRSALQTERRQTEALAAQSITALDDRLAGLQSERAAAERELEVCKERVASAERSVGRNRELAKAGFLSPAALDARQDELLKLRGDLASTERTLAVLIGQIAAVKSERAQTPTRTIGRLAEIDRSLFSLDQEQTEAQVRNRVAVTAPIAGTVTAVLGDEGQSVGTRPLATILPEGAPLEARLFLDSRAIGFVELGQPVRLRYQAYLYQKFGQYQGRVVDISRAQIQPDDLPAALATPAREGLYRISVTLRDQAVIAYGKPQQLVAGMALEADILQDRRRLIEWILQPLFSVTEKISA